jgi:phage FluMu protein Com
MIQAVSVRCPSCGKKVAESLQGALRVVCPRCRVAFTVST